MRMLIVVLLLTGVAQAQTHPCEVAPPSTTVRVGDAVGFASCHDGKDLNGNTSPITKMRVTVDGVEQFNAMPTADGPASSSGKTLWRMPPTVTGLTVGNHTAVIYFSNATGEAAGSSLPFPVSEESPPQPPTVCTAAVESTAALSGTGPATIEVRHTGAVPDGWLVSVNGVKTNVGLIKPVMTCADSTTFGYQLPVTFASAGTFTVGVIPYTGTAPSWVEAPLSNTIQVQVTAAPAVPTAGTSSRVIVAPPQ